MNDTLCRLFFFDKCLDELPKDLTSWQFSEELLRIKGKIESQSTEEMNKWIIRKRQLPAIFWFYRLWGKDYTKEFLDPKTLFVERFQHKNWEIQNTGGTRMYDYKYNNHPNLDTTHHIENMKLFEKFNLIPIVEEIDYEKYEILVGHHRALGLIRSRKYIPVLLVKRGNFITEIVCILAKVCQRVSYCKNLILGK